MGTSAQGEDLVHSVVDSFVYPEHSTIKAVTLPNGLHVEYALHGNASAPDKLVLLMGLGAQKEAWLLFLTAFYRKPGHLERFQVLTPDNRGAGGTDGPRGAYTTSQMAQDTLQLLDHLMWPRVHVAGVSMGGMIAQKLGAIAPTRVRSLALLVTTPGFSEAPAPGWSNVKAYASIFRCLLKPTHHAKTMAALQVSYPAEYLALAHDTMDALYAIHSTRIKIGDQKPTGSWGQYRAVLNHRMSRANLQKIQEAGFPILILGAGQDRLIPVSHSKVLSDRLSGARTNLVIVEAAGHMIHMQFRTKLVHILTEHLISCDRVK
ncbi:Aste57867_21320 [Aphanomyces stellatus]|uniref:Aste57867_21320 protein n=1 Tax=Aphanomyces stellatus TaxID=120398 RepID=A0A485LHT9_9STRA|nr:hypothetical protein As57867_021251 [Aphanomyces stellatus]VFT97992.1 Aste57867_21320 [Aphanomyces stellatus]